VRDEGVGVGERRQKRGGREFEVEDDGFRVAGFDLVDHRIVAATRADDPFRWVNDPVPARRHVVGGLGRTVLEADILADRECVGPGATRRLGNLGADSGK
jgi:hypothetical protein